MIFHTFSLLDGVGERLERRMWNCGILTWDDFINADFLPYISKQKGVLLKEMILYFREELKRLNPEPFYYFLKHREHWRLFEIFKSDVACLDIETNGLPIGRGGKVTVVGLYNGVDWRYFIKGEDLTEERLKAEISRYKLLVTFFGSTFDIPFLERAFPGFRLKIPHFDLCSGARQLGLRGGLKKIEEIFGISRMEEVKGMNGYDAVLLWEKWLRGSSRALDLLLRYNREDTVNLFPLAEKIYGLLRKSTGVDIFLKRALKILI